MTLKITKQIGTSRGITSNGYVRIESFEFRKGNGFLRVYPIMYMNEHEAASASRDLFDEHSPAMLPEEWEAKNFEINEVYTFHLTESQVRSREYLRVESISSSVDQMIPDPENPGQEITSSYWEYDSITISGSEDYAADVISVNAITGSSIYNYAYPLLKAELKNVFGDANVSDS